MFIKDLLTLSLLKKVLDETHADGKNLSLSLDGLFLRQECYYEPAHVKYYRYYSMPFDVGRLEDYPFTIRDEDVVILLNAISKQVKEQGTSENIMISGSSILIKL